MKVIHFVESGGSGVWSALHNWITATPDLQHIILVRPRTGEYQEFKYDIHKPQIIFWQGNLLKGIFQLLQISAKEQVDLIHLHSTWSGLARFFKWRKPIIYSPHAFAFQNTVISSSKRAIFHFVEKILSFRTDGYVVVSSNESSLAFKLNKKKKIQIIHHCVDPWTPKSPLNRIIGVGRLVDQKNPFLFAEIAKNVKKSGLEIEFIWIGDGEVGNRKRLLESNVLITGWLEYDQLLETASDALCLLHTALWEGMPVIFSEMLAAGIPIMALKREYLLGCNNILQFEDSDEALEQISDLLGNPRRNSPHSNSKEIEGEKLKAFYERFKNETH